MGDKYPSGPTPVYPPRDWACPQCGKYHSRAHWRDKRQESGFYKEESKSQIDCVSVSDPKLKFDKDGVPQPLFCPHCGWVDDIDVLIMESTQTKKERSIIRWRKNDN
jgi:ssDNA-binding Zn-finger/Zn-ribbon topoisomerase 1